ncbi:MAG TPA: NYN domain-containing protein [Candidatus Diapherotrites archaeon]|uniref:NYN domain-containing protein n=1 Tax=Candidatus Iainarchaeum sp. TaxID=3101447 RepID=A0A7J4JG21_9ARCH|nr:NYN domain-containing protein [Candidatus Diapherotrites archaeon]
MPAKKAYLFIDGSNFYHAIKNNGFAESFAYESFYRELGKCVRYAAQRLSRHV